MDSDELSGKVSTDAEDIDIQARNILNVMVCGSFRTEEDKATLTNVKMALREDLKVFTFTMDDIKTKQELSFPQKFELIWQNMNGGGKIPMFILYGGKSATSSPGFNSELQDIAKDEEMLSCAHLFLVPGIQLTGYMDRFEKRYEVKSEEEFIQKAKKIITARLEIIKAFLTYKRREKNGKL